MLNILLIQLIVYTIYCIIYLLYTQYVYHTIHRTANNEEKMPHVGKKELGKRGENSQKKPRKDRIQLKSEAVRERDTSN